MVFYNSYLNTQISLKNSHHIQESTIFKILISHYLLKLLQMQKIPPIMDSKPCPSVGKNILDILDSEAGFPYQNLKICETYQFGQG